MKIAWIIISWAILSQTLVSAQIPVNGFITAADGMPLGWVNVVAAGTSRGAMTDESGFFSFLADSSEKIILKVSLVGYAPVEKVLVKGKGKTTGLNITLQEEDIRLSDIVVTASAWSSSSVGALPVSPMEIVRTPGGAADIFQMLKTLPGLTPASENADLIIRGGEAGEALILVDETPIRSPFKYESANGGLFSQIPAGMSDGIWFSSGGFPAKFGNALSGVLDISTRNEPSTTGLTAGWNLAGAMADASISSSSGRSGWNLALTRDDTNPMMVANQQSGGFEKAPSSLLAMGGWVTRLGETGRLKLTGLSAADKQAVRLDYPGADLIYSGETESHRIILSGSGVVLPDFLISGAAAFGFSEKKWRLGIIDLKGSEPENSFRLDADWLLTGNQKILTGGELVSWRGSWNGTVPTYTNQPPNSGPVTDYRSHYQHHRFGYYAEWEQGGLFLSRALSTRIGLRTDGGSDRSYQTIDPRLQISVTAGENWTVSGAAGIYSQSATLRTDNGINEFPVLPAMRSFHAVLSLVRSGSNNENNFRFELYNKQLSKLPEWQNGTYRATGYGWARGADIIYDGEFPYDIRGRISYGYLTSKRKWKSTGYLAPSDADITHAVTWVGRRMLTTGFELGWTVKLASGRPYTPVESAMSDSSGSYLIPLFAPENSSRLPGYFRVDSRLTWMGTVFDRFFGVCYAEILNILDTENLMGYHYSENYQQKQGVVSYFGKRTVVVGMQLTW